jgi:lysophospholipase L1-like esterase
VTLSRARWFSAVTAVVLGLVLACGACTSRGSAGRSANEPTTPAARPIQLVVMGSDVTLGDSLDDALRDAWPRLLFDSLPPGSRLVNAASDLATARAALRDQAPIVEEVRPDVVAAILGTDDVVDKTPLTTFRREFSALIARVAAKSGRVLVGNLPAIGITRAGAAPYNAVIADVAAEYHVQLVDLSEVQAQDAGTTQHRSIAAAFETALAQR